MTTRLAVPQPCSADWAQMTPVAGGRFCGRCEKVVVDFSRMSAAEVQAWLGRNGRSCGRFRAGQLAAPAAPRSWAAWLAAVAVSLSGCESAPPKPEDALGRVRVVAAAADSVVVRGRVLNEADQPLAGAFISSHADTAYFTRSQPDGSFALTLPAALADSLLLVAQPPTEEQYYIPRLAHPAPGLTVRLRPHPDVMGEFVLEPGEFSPPPTAPPPPPPKLSTVDFTAPGSATK